MNSNPGLLLCCPMRETFSGFPILVQEPAFFLVQKAAPPPFSWVIIFHPLAQCWSCNSPVLLLIIFFKFWDFFSSSPPPLFSAHLRTILIRPNANGRDKLGSVSEAGYWLVLSLFVAVPRGPGSSQPSLPHQSSAAECQQEGKQILTELVELVYILASLLVPKQNGGGNYSYFCSFCWFRQEYPSK